MAQAFDKELLERVDGDVAFLADTVQMLETDGRSLMSELRTALAAGDTAKIGGTAHTLKGMISNFCAPAVQGAALDVEKAGKAGDCACAATAVARLEPNLEALIGELSAFVQARN